MYLWRWHNEVRFYHYALCIMQYLWKLLERMNLIPSFLPSLFYIHALHCYFKQIAQDTLNRVQVRPAVFAVVYTLPCMHTSQQKLEYMCRFTLFFRAWFLLVYGAGP